MTWLIIIAGMVLCFAAGWFTAHIDLIADALDRSAPIDDTETDVPDSDQFPTLTDYEVDEIRRHVRDCADDVAAAMGVDVDAMLPKCSDRGFVGRSTYDPAWEANQKRQARADLGRGQ